MATFPIIQNQTTLVYPPQKKSKKFHRHFPLNIPQTAQIPNVSMTCSEDQNQTRTLINCLSDDVIEHIFSFLSIKRAAQMGILSARFKDSWLFNRKLLFDRDFARTLNRFELIAIVNRVFDSHMGSKIQCFRLYFNHDGSEIMAQSWISKSIEKGVEELDLDFYQGTDPFKLPCKFLFVETMRVLKLCYCVIDDLPTQLNVLSLLSTVTFKKVYVSSKVIETLINHCLFLEKIQLVQCDEIYQLKISANKHKRLKALKIGDCEEVMKIEIEAPSLNTFYYKGAVRSIKITNVPQLNDVMLNFTPSKGFSHSLKVENLVSDLSHIPVLTATSTFLEGLTTRFRDGLFRDLQFCFWNLREFQLLMEGARFCNLCDIASFLSNCPCIEKLYIDLNEFSFESGVYWELHQKQQFEKYTSSFFHCLKFVKIKGFKFDKYETELVRLFLTKALSLESIVLVLPRNGNVKIQAKDGPIYSKLFVSWKVSPEAKILVYENSHEMCSFNPKHIKIWF